MPYYSQLRIAVTVKSSTTLGAITHWRTTIRAIAIVSCARLASVSKSGEWSTTPQKFSAGSTVCFYSAAVPAIAATVRSRVANVLQSKTQSRRSTITQKKFAAVSAVRVSGSTIRTGRHRQAPVRSNDRLPLCLTVVRTQTIIMTGFSRATLHVLA